jgi:hypothetical protein
MFQKETMRKKGSTLPLVTNYALQPSTKDARQLNLFTGNTDVDKELLSYLSAGEIMNLYLTNKYFQKLIIDNLRNIINHNNVELLWDIANNAVEFNDRNIVDKIVSLLNTLNIDNDDKDYVYTAMSLAATDNIPALEYIFSIAPEGFDWDPFLEVFGKNTAECVAENECEVKIFYDVLKIADKYHIKNIVEYISTYLSEYEYANSEEGIKEQQEWARHQQECVRQQKLKDEQRRSIQDALRKAEEREIQLRKQRSEEVMANLIEALHNKSERVFLGRLRSTRNKGIPINYELLYQYANSELRSKINNIRFDK